MPNPISVQTTPYFESLNQLLKRQGEGVPHLVIDLDRLDHNLNQLKERLPKDTHIRLVAKSLPCEGLLHYIAERLSCQKFMTFHLPFLRQLTQSFPNSELLLGKPLPARAVTRFYEQLSTVNSGFNAEKQLHWLVDTPERLAQYLSIAQKFQQVLNVCIEIDIGLHRGGIQNSTTLDVMLTTIRNHPRFLRFSGFMGYDAHVGKLPKWVEPTQTSYQKSQACYQSFIDYAQSYFPELCTPSLLLNGAGSPTIELHKTATVCNDLSVGSALVKPSHFDLSSLSEYQPASFIASPILKQWSGMMLPGPDWLSRLIGRLQPGARQTLFIYGGNWHAEPVDARLKDNALYGQSANQAILNGPKDMTLHPDDHVFWRPRESEAVFLQFGDILAIRNSEIVERWPVFNPAITSSLAACEFSTTE
jgi:D-serine deaminase-like pyridoxal phosphate-dependent protein